MTQLIRLTLRPVKQFRLWLCLGLVGISACSTSSNDRDARETTVSPPPAVAGPKDTVGDASRLQWTLANLEEVLQKNGLNPIRRGSVRQPFISSEGTLYQIGDAELQVYLYADAVAVARDTDPLDTTRVAPPTMMVSWRMPPTLIVDNNIVLILLTRDDAVRRRIKEAIEKSHRD